MTIRVNGEPLEIAGPLSISALLAELQIDARRVAVEHNLTVVKRARYDEVVVQGGDEIEIVNFVGGGAEETEGTEKCATRRRGDTEDRITREKGA